MNKRIKSLTFCIVLVAFLTPASISFAASLDFETITVADTAIGFTAAKIAPDVINGSRPVSKVFITNETAEIRFRLDGSDPSSTVGHLMAVGDSIIIDGADKIYRFKAIRTGGTSGTLSVTYER